MRKTTGYAVPIAVLNPSLAKGLFVDYLVRGHFHIIPKNPQMLAPETVAVLTQAGDPTENPVNASDQVHGDAESGFTEIPSAAANSGLKEIMATHE
jgi:hypothetical protein